MNHIHSIHHSNNHWVSQGMNSYPSNNRNLDNVKSLNPTHSELTRPNSVKRTAFGDLSNVSYSNKNVLKNVKVVNPTDATRLKSSRSTNVTYQGTTATVNVYTNNKRKRIDDNKGVSSVASQVLKERALKSARRNPNNTSRVSSSSSVPASTVSVSTVSDHSHLKNVNRDLNRDSIEPIQTKRVKITKENQENTIPTTTLIIKKRDSGISISSNHRLSITIESTCKSKDTFMSYKDTSKDNDKNTSKKELKIIRPHLPILVNADESGFLDRDPLLVAEYANEIYSYLKQYEVKHMPNPEYMSFQGEINWNMRSVLVDWMSLLSHKFKFLPETLYHGVHYLDRFLSLKSVSVPKLQLAGCTCLLLACKFEQVVVPRVREWIHAMDGTYPLDEFLKAERYILKTLDFQVSETEPFHILRRISKADRYAQGPRVLSKYLMELTLLDQRFLVWPVSRIASACMYFSLVLLNMQWTSLHESYSGYSRLDLNPLALTLCDLLKKTGLNESWIYKKHSTPQFMNASEFVDNRIKEMCL